MAEEINSQSLAESALIQPETPKVTSSGFDQQPVGAGSKFQFSQYPSENDQPPVRKAPPARKPNKPKNQQPKASVEEMPPKNSRPLDEIPVGGNNAKGVFDEKPIGKSEGAFNISEFPEGQPEEPQTTNYTMAQKLKSKAIKLRLSGLEDLLQLINQDPESPELSEITMAPLLKETTPANLEKSLQCLKAWMQKGRNWGEDEAKNAIQNGYINGKPNTKKLTMQIVDEMYETKADMIEMLILVGFKNKTPKIIAGYNSVLNELLAIYGIRRMKYLKPYLPEVVRVIGAEKLAAVKQEGMNTLKEAYKWMGKETVQPMLSNLKEALKKELDHDYESYDKTQVMTAPKDIVEEGSGKAKGKKIDAYELSEAVDIFKKYNQKWSESVIKAEKWNQKTKMMEQFVKAASVPKLANSETRHITELIRRLINDSNMNVVLWTLKIIAVMAKGLRKNFVFTAKSQFANIIAKFREKKTQMVQQTFSTLNELNHCLAIEDVLEDVMAGLGDKAPTMRCNLMNWIGRHVEQKIEQKGGECPEKTRDSIKRMFPIFQKLLEDGVAEVRDTMVKNLAKLELLMGQDYFAPVKGKINKKVASKIASKVQEKAEAMAQDRNSKKKEEDMSKSAVSIKGTIKNDSKVSTKGATLEKEKQKQKEKEKEEKVSLECYQQPFFDESLQTLVGLGFPEEEVKNVTANGANQRGNVLNYLRENPYENFNAVLRVIRRAFKEWKEVNLKMNKDFISYLQERAGDIGKPEAYVLIPYISEKIGQSKFSQQLMNVVVAMCERVPARFLVGHFIRYAKSPQNKKPKLNGDICSIIIKIIELASISNCNLKQVAQYARQTYAVPFSKKGAQELLVCLYSQAGQSIKPLLDENTLKNMESTFKGIKPLTEDQKKPKVQFIGQAATESQTITKKDSLKQDSGKPRDLSVQVQKALPLINDNSNWQKRKDGAQLLIGQLQFGGKISFGSSLGDLLSSIKAHINDTNKQLIKLFVHLAGLILISLPEKQIKTNLKGFILTLVQGLSDKNQQNRNQIVATLGRIADNIGKQHILSNLAPYLEGGKQGRLQVLHLILAHEDGIPKSDIRDYPKGLVNCLCDKNKDIRAAAEKVFEKVHEKLGLEVFRTIAKDQRPVVAKDLNSLIDRFDKNLGTSSSFASKGVSPSKISQKQPKPRQTLTQHPPQPTSAKKRSLSRNNPNTKSFIEQDPRAMTSTQFFAPPKPNKVEGNELFASCKLLITERVQRLSTEEIYVWRLDEIRQSQQEAVRTDIEALIREDIAKKLLSFDYRRVMEGVTYLIKSSKDINQQAQLKQMFDVLLKWILLRLWGGQPAFCNAIELVFPLLSVLQKKKAVLTDFEVDLVISIIRQYFISAHLIGPKISESLYSIIKCLIPLSSGERVLKKILRQFTIDLPAMHRHLKKDVNAFFRQGLCRLIKKQLADHVGNEDTLQEASKIKELKEDPEFVNMLFRRFHEDVLRCFGFRKLDAYQLPSRSPQPQAHLNESGVSTKPPHPSHPSSVAGNNSFVNENARDRSGERMPPPGHPNTMSQDIRPSQLPGKPLDRKSNLSQHQINKPPQQPTQSYMTPTSPSHARQTIVSDPYDSQTLDLSIYPAPHPASPLSKHLNKLLPPNQSIINFFNTLFQETGEKIANQLATNAKIIFGSILKSVHDLLAMRKEYTPERIVAQITLLQSCIKCQHVMKNIGQLLGNGTQFALTQLVYEDQHKSEIYEELRSRNIEYRADNFIKAVNGVMLRILENANPQDIVNVLLQLLIYHSRAIPNSPKTISLVVKCIGRVSKDFGKDLRPDAIKLFLFRAYQYLSLVEYDIYLEQLDLQEKERNREKIRPEDSTANAIKSILIEVCKALGSEIWEHYEKAMVEAQTPDRWINSFITALNVKQPDRVRGRSQQNRQNEELKKINELLSKNRSYETGIAQLKRYTQLHPEFNAEEYFTSLNYDRKFIQMVVSSLDGQRRSIMKGENRDQQAPESIQERIKRLKERFQELQPQGEGSGNNSMNRGPPVPEQQQKEERALQIRRRIEEMKNKMNSAVRNR